MSRSDDLTECTAEPLSHLGLVQPHGGLLVLDRMAEVVQAASVGVGAMLGLAADPLPGDAARLPAGLADALRALPEDAVRPMPVPMALPGGDAGLECLAHRADGRLVAEWVRPLDDRTPAEAEAAGFAAALAAAPDLLAGAQALVRQVAALAGYDRVVAYRFREDWSGEVVAEARRPELLPFLGLRYPASDIPAQARELYRRNLLRVVADVQDVPLRLRHAGETPPDLGMALLRAVSPSHVQYLRNMGVRATLTLSLLEEGRLWGMVACHHRSPRLPGIAVREAVAAAGRCFQGLLDRAAAREAGRQAAALAGLRREIGQPPGPDALVRLLMGHAGLAAAADAQGIAWVGGGWSIAIGLAPDVAELARLAGEAGPPGTLQAVTRLALPMADPMADPLRVQPAGMLAIALEGGWLALFRRELVQEIHWAGDPGAAVERGPQGRPLPRRSFALCWQQVRGTSRCWGKAERALLRAAAGMLAEAGPVRVVAGRAAGWARGVAEDGLLVRQGLASLLMSRVNALLLEGPDGRLAGMTAGLASLLGATGRELEGRPWREAAPLLGLRPLEEGEAGRWHVAYSPTLGPLTLRLGLETALQVAGPGDAAGEARRLDLMTVEDETRTGRLAAALRASTRQRQGVRRSREAILRNVGHELRTPLHAVIGFAELLMAVRLPLNPAVVKAQATEIAAAGQDMLRLVENLLTASRLQAGRLNPRHEPFDLAVLLRQQAAMLGPLFAAKPVRLRMVLPQAAPCVGDASLLGPAVANLLSNALRFTPPTGDVECRLELSAGMAEIRVTDTGPGVAPEHRQRIFEAFEQEDVSIRRQHGGTGLGLFIATAMVELQGGSLTLEQPPGGGSCFVIRMPVEAQG